MPETVNNWRKTELVLRSISVLTLAVAIYAKIRADAADAR